MITAKKNLAELKLEVLTAIRKQNFEFEQNFEGDVNSSANCKKEIESENFNITVELAENVVWSSFRDYDFKDLEVIDFIVTDENGDECHSEFTDNEILYAINY